MCESACCLNPQKNGTWKHSGQEDESWIWGISVNLNSPNRMLELE